MSSATPAALGSAGLEAKQWDLAFGLRQHSVIPGEEDRGPGGKRRREPLDGGIDLFELVFPPLGLATVPVPGLVQLIDVEVHEGALPSCHGFAGGRRARVEGGAAYEPTA